MNSKLLSLSLLIASAAGAETPLLSPAPPRDAFSEATDAAARQSLGEKKSCHARDGLDLSGDAAYVWGSNFHVASAATCCEACAAHRKNCGNGSSGTVYWSDGKHKLRCGRGRGRCNAFVYCAADEQCFSYDIHVHKRGECWLKHEPNISHPIAAGPTLPRVMVDAPRSQWPWQVSKSVWKADKPPERISWQSGIVAPRTAPAWSGLKVPGWQKSFCKKHGPC